MVLKCLRSHVCWVRSVLTPLMLYNALKKAVVMKNKKMRQQKYNRNRNRFDTTKACILSCRLTGERDTGGRNLKRQHTFAFYDST